MSNATEVMNTRWPRVSESDEIDAAAAIHARRDWSDDRTVCEQGGGSVVPADSVTLVLSAANASNVTRPVDCPDCLEWMHA